tara:strand:+ start:545 stop:1135 length:591 start_codon:yes stop_codon:yes gene_type:complete
MSSKKVKKIGETDFHLTGQILVAMPQMQDPRFKKSVIFMCGHDDHGAMGIVVNKLIESVTFEDLLQQLNLENIDKSLDIQVHYGGPVEIGRGFVLHSTDYMAEASVEVTNDIALSASTTVLDDVILGNGPDHILLALGYAGWSSGQLEEEIMKNGWLTLPADGSILFDTKPDTLWQRTLQKFGVDPDHLFAHTGHA